MIRTNNIISPLPFYDNIELQNHRKSYAYGQIYCLITHRNMLLPFQFCIASGTTIKSVLLHSLSTGSSTDITSNMLENGLTIKSFTNFKVVKYPGLFPVEALKLEGQYYLEIIVDNKHYYSDIFTSVYDVSNCLLLEYSNSYSFTMANGVIDFSDNFKFKCYLRSEIGKPEYTFEEEATDRGGYTFVESQISKKVYKFVFLAPEYLCDALRIVRLCDYKHIVSGLINYEPTSLTMEPSWEEQGDIAAVEVEFETDTVIANIGGYKPVLLDGDFNNDFNNDYLTE